MVAAAVNIFGREETKEFSERRKKEAYTIPLQISNCVRERLISLRKIKKTQENL